jgi:hypothetical protein
VNNNVKTSDSSGSLVFFLHAVPGKNFKVNVEEKRFKVNVEGKKI